jgi:uncharacterized protein (DUF1499 family)
MSRLLRLSLLILVGSLAGFGLLRWLVALASPPPQNLGVSDGRLSLCPQKDNCVSTRDTDERWAIPPIPYSGDTAVAQQRILAIVAEAPRSALMVNEPGYIHAEFRTLLWGFVDDVEFQFDAEAGLIHFRSFARLGYGDLGVNRARMEAIRAAWEAAAPN